MSKPIRLLNVDKIVTSSGHEVDLNNVLKPPSEWVIDGAAKSASCVLNIGGYQGGGISRAQISKHTLSDNSLNTSWSSLPRATDSPACSSNGNRWMATAGMNSHVGYLTWTSPQWWNNIVIGDFDSNSISTDIGTLNDDYGSGASGLSEGTNHYSVGGGHGHAIDLGDGSRYVHDYILKFAYDDSSTSQVDFGTITQKKTSIGATCDHDNGYLVGGIYAGGKPSFSTPTLSTTEIEKFSCSSAATGIDANMAANRAGESTAGNGDRLVSTGSYNETWTTITDIVEYQFASKAVNNSHGSIPSGKQALTACSTGDDIMGVVYENGNSYFYRLAWESGSTAINHGANLGAAGECVAGG